jgi:Bpu10I-like restriction endonuclease
MGSARIVESSEADLSPVDPQSPTPHYDKLRELLNNQKLPTNDAQNIRRALDRYHAWIRAMGALDATGDDRVKALVDLLNEYKQFVEVEVIWDSSADFLYRQRGQLKLDNSVIEEFLPRLVDPRIIPALAGRTYTAGPKTGFSASYFATSLTLPAKGAGLQIRTKDHDFTVGRTAYLRSSFDSLFPPADTITHEVYLAFVAAECKTNLDKTMFQEVIATAHDLKSAISGARFYVLCEWLDMTPISTRSTDIDEVIILRGKRIASNIRARFSTSAARQHARDWYLEFLTANPIRISSVLRFVNHLRSLFDFAQPDEGSTLERGYF